MTRVGPSARTVPLLRATVLALKAMDKDVRKRINDETRGTLNPEWREAIATHAAGSRMDNLVFGKGARIAAGNPARLMSTTSKRPLRKGSNGFVPNAMGRLLEFPTATPGKRSTYTRTSPAGRRHEVTRRTMTGLPVRRNGGRVVYPAVADVMPRFVSMWVQIVVKIAYEALDGKK